MWIKTIVYWFQTISYHNQYHNAHIVSEDIKSLSQHPHFKSSFSRMNLVFPQFSPFILCHSTSVSTNHWWVDCTIVKSDDCSILLYYVKCIQSKPCYTRSLKSKMTVWTCLLKGMDPDIYINMDHCFDKWFCYHNISLRQQNDDEFDTTWKSICHAPKMAYHIATVILFSSNVICREGMI